MSHRHLGGSPHACMATIVTSVTWRGHVKIFGEKYLGVGGGGGGRGTKREKKKKEKKNKIVQFFLRCFDVR